MLSSFVEDIVRYAGSADVWLTGNFTQPSNVWLQLKSASGHICGIQGQTSRPAHGSSNGDIGINMGNNLRLSGGRVRYCNDGVWRK